MTDILIKVGLTLLFVLIGGVFAAAEMALVTLRDTQVQQLSQRGKRGAAVRRLVDNPNRFLSSVQIGVTVAGFTGAAFGADALAEPFASLLVAWGLSESVAGLLAFVVITVAISYASIVLGELSAKRLAMQRAESLSLALAPLIDAIATVLRPVIWLLGVSANLVVRLLGGDPAAGKEEVSGEELRAMLGSAQSLGDEERRIVDDVFDAGERTLREVMVPRTEVDFLPGEMAAGKAMRAVRGAPHSRYPVTAGSADEICGFLHVRDLMDLDSVERSTPLHQLCRPIVSLPETVVVLRALSDMRKTSAHMAIVRDEYGGTAGIVTLEDLVEELIGDITDEYDVVDEHANDLSDVDGLTSLEDFADLAGFRIPEGPYDTVAGFIMAELGQLPAMGDRVQTRLLSDTQHDVGQEFEFVVTQLEGRRASRVAVKRV